MLDSYNIKYWGKRTSQKQMLTFLCYIRKNFLKYYKNLRDVRKLIYIELCKYIRFQIPKTIYLKRNKNISDVFFVKNYIINLGIVTIVSIKAKQYGRYNKQLSILVKPTNKVIKQILDIERRCNYSINWPWIKHKSLKSIICSSKYILVKINDKDSLLPRDETDIKCFEWYYDKRMIRNPPRISLELNKDIKLQMTISGIFMNEYFASLKREIYPLLS